MRNLWAPWRMEFIKDLRDRRDQGCFLCRAAEEDADEENLVVGRGEKCFCVMNRYPYNNGHLLVAPCRHEGALERLDDAELLGLMRLAIRARRALTDLVSPDGFNIGLNLGRTAGAGLVEHLHVHVVPRWDGDTNFMPVIAEAKVIPQALADLCGQLRDAWAQPRPVP